MVTTEAPKRHLAVAPPGAVARRSPEVSKARAVATPYLLLLPAVVMYGVFVVYPVYRQFEISFFNWHIFPSASNPFVGLSNYVQILHDPVVRTAALNSLLYIVVTVPAQMALGLLAAAVLADRLPGGMFWRAAVYIPVVTSWVVVSYIFAYMFSSQGGVANAVVGFFVGHRVDIPWTAEKWTGELVVWLIGIWKGVGWSFIIFLAALDGVPRELLESARIDVAGEPRIWQRVVLPAIRPAVMFVTVLLVIGGAQVFTQMYLVTKGGPYNSTQALMPYMYQQALGNFAFGYAAALASLLAVVLFGLSWAEIRLMRQQEG
jgi:multiple sugar transport system permease protein